MFIHKDRKEKILCGKRYGKFELGSGDQLYLRELVGIITWGIGITRIELDVHRCQTFLHKRSPLFNDEKFYLSF